jgi:hypothetical protein
MNKFSSRYAFSPSDVGKELQSMSEVIPPLAELEIHGLTKKRGFTQEKIDRMARFIYEERPDFYERMAKRESDFPGKKVQDPNAGPYDAFAQEFDKWIEENFSNEVDTKSNAAMGSIFWEVRRRARKMYGMRI